MDVTRRTKLISAGVALALCVIAAAIFPDVLSAHNTRKAIATDWARLEAACKSGDWGSFGGEKIAFKDGDYLAILYYDDHDRRNGWLTNDYVLGMSGKGRRICSSHHFCGYEGLCGQLVRDDYASLEDFLKRTVQFGWSVESSVSP